MCFDSNAVPPIPVIAGAAVTTEELTLQAEDGAQVGAVLATSGASKAGIVVMPDIRGLHKYYQDLAERFAERGYDSVAIDYFGRTAGIGHPAQRGESFVWQEHIALAKADGIANDVAAAAKVLRDRGNTAVFTIGFCFGGSHSWNQATYGHNIAGAIGFYGNPSRPTRDGSPTTSERIAEIDAPLLGLFGGNDPGIPQSTIDEFDRQLTDAAKEHEFTSYDGAPHSFFDRTFEDYKEACDDAWKRVLAFVDKHSK